ncbi:hypothetical protein, partial [Aeromonas salmonicida]|uniref:hypothetical protein n=1 Tax=Aeromonas salmonicida TaxID=645 RepID=UPI001BB2BD80
GSDLVNNAPLSRYPVIPLSRYPHNASNVSAPARPVFLWIWASVFCASNGDSLFLFDGIYSDFYL